MKSLLCFYCLLVWSGWLVAQSLTYEQARDDGIARFEALDYEDAIKKFEAARLLTQSVPQQTEIAGWLDRAKDARLNALRQALTALEREKQKSDSALTVANQVLDQLYFYEGKFGLSVKNVGRYYEPIHRFGFIDPNGETVIPFGFEEATPFMLWDGFARVTEWGKKYLLDTTGVKYLLAESLTELTAETEALDLHKQETDSFPADLGAFLNLRVILAYGEWYETGQIQRIPKGMEELAKLEHLDLSNNQLTELPQSLTGLTKLRYLDLRRNKLPAKEIDRLKQQMPNCMIMH